jgi:hypothetical protein
LAVLSEQGPFRQILTDGRALPKDPNPTWMGYSVGRSMKVELKGDQLIAQPPRGGGFPLVPESDTVFSGSGARVEFFRDPQGAVTHSVVRTVEGDQTGTRKR